jgi:hypothetical protein
MSAISAICFPEVIVGLHVRFLCCLTGPGCQRRDTGSKTDDNHVQ